MSDTKNCDFCGRDITVAKFITSTLSMYDHNIDQCDFEFDVCAKCKPKVKRAIGQLIKVKR